MHDVNCPPGQRDTAFVASLRQQGYSGIGQKRSMGDDQPVSLNANSSASSNTSVRKDAAAGSSGQRKSPRSSRGSLLAELNQFDVLDVEVAGGVSKLFMEKKDLGDFGKGSKKAPLNGQRAGFMGAQPFVMPKTRDGALSAEVPTNHRFLVTGVPSGADINMAGEWELYADFAVVPGALSILQGGFSQNGTPKVRKKSTSQTTPKLAEEKAYRFHVDLSDEEKFPKITVAVRKSGLGRKWAKSNIVELDLDEDSDSGEKGAKSTDQSGHSNKGGKKKK